MTTYLDSTETLELLGLYKKDRHAKPNHHYIQWLVDRDLLPRIVMGPRTFRYERSDVEKLLKKVKTEGLQLTLKPVKK